MDEAREHPPSGPLARRAVTGPVPVPLCRCAAEPRTYRRPTGDGFTGLGASTSPRPLGAPLHNYLKMFTARAITRATVSNAIPLCTSISIFAQRLRGIVSVGLNAVAFVKLT